ncbi:O-antigen ligase [uncultured Clostridium sp.]|uniref:O-antigen ligase family protein n=1 Tax=uncultured Clostridium sp. TaxID=59620 RepID=UPI0025FD237C|nr:O-antigen ligase family protein [uncultured Clostridium sp.]
MLDIVSFNDLKIRKSDFWVLYLFLLFTTELWAFTLFGGNMRIYYFVNFILFCCMGHGFKRLIDNCIMRNMLLFCGILLVSNIFSTDLKGSMAATVSLFLNVIGAFIIYLVLNSGKISFTKFMKYFDHVLLLCLLFGLFALALFRFTGYKLAFTEVGKTQLSQFQIAGFRTEANTHGKLACFAAAYSIPFMLRENANAEKKILFCASVLTLVISPTRAATYALLAAIIVLLIFYIREGQSNLVMKKIFVALMIGTVIYIFLSCKIIKIGGYSLEKLQNFFVFGASELREDGSGGFRLEAISSGLKFWLQSPLTFLFGVGFGQTYAYLQAGEVFTRTGGTEFITLLSGTGVFTAAAWIITIWCTFKLMAGTAHSLKRDNEDFFATVAESMMTIIVYIFTIGFTSGTMYVPECWIAFGIAAYIHFWRKAFMAEGGEA